MEVFRQISKDGTTYRIVDDGNFFMHIYSIEYLQIYEDCEVWKPVYEPKNKLFTSLEECRNEFDKLILS